MLTVNIHDAKTQLSKLVAMAVSGKPFIIAKAGKPQVKVEAIVNLDEPPPLRGMGFLKGKVSPVLVDFDTMFENEIEAMFYGEK